jgi:microcystin-dependent protein
MADPFIGEVKISAYTYAPRGWAFCDGQIMPIQQNQALFSLLGTFYGGNGQTTFGLPDLRGRVAVHADFAQYNMGQVGGEPAHTLTGNEMPMPHLHQLQAVNIVGTVPILQNAVYANAGLNAYAQPNPPQPVVSATISTTGGQPHDNMSPYLGLTFCIALVGIFPSRN